MRQINLSPPEHLKNALGLHTLRIETKEPDEGPVEMLVHGVIGDEWDGLDSGNVASWLSDHRGRGVHVRINSPGGLAYDGVAIYNALSHHDGDVNVTVEGIAASAATIIAMAGDHVSMHENSTFMIHRAWGLAIGNRETMAEMTSVLDKLDGQITGTYAARTGQSKAEMLGMRTGDVDGTYLDAYEALAAGFIDDIIPSKSKKRDDDKESRKRQAKARMRQVRAEQLSRADWDGIASWML